MKNSLLLSVGFVLFCSQYCLATETTHSQSEEIVRKKTNSEENMDKNLSNTSMSRTTYENKNGDKTHIFSPKGFKPPRALHSQYGKKVTHPEIKDTDSGVHLPSPIIAN